MTTLVLSTFLIGFFLLLAAVVILPIFFGAPWHPLPSSTIQRILGFAEIQPGERLYDLGSGDGRVLIAAARDYKANGVGVEIDPIKAGVSRWLIQRAGVKDRVNIYRGDLNKFDCGEADVLYLYLTHQALDRLFPDILGRLKPSVRIVSYRFLIRELEPVKVSEDKTLFLYRLNKGKTINDYS